MAGYIGKSQGVTQVDGYTRSEADAEHTGTQTFNRTSTDGDIIDFRKDGTTVGSIGSYGGTDLTIGSGDTGLRFYAAGDKIWSYNTSTGLNSDALVTLGDTNKRFKNLYLSGGVYLGGTGSANYLDDYEEGTWTPVIKGSSGGTATIGSFYQTIYTKIGRVVNAFFYIGNVDTTGGGISGSVRIGGLPFNASVGTSYNYGQNASVGYCNLFTFDEADISMYGYVEGTDVQLSKGSSMTTLTASEITSTTTGRMMFGITYCTDA